MEKGFTEHHTLDIILILDDFAVQKIICETARDDLIKALLGVNEAIKNKIFKNVSRIAAVMLKEDSEAFRHAEKADIEFSKQRIVEVIRRLESCGEIVIPD